MSEEIEPSSSENPYSLAGITFSRFRESFGDPNITIKTDRQWTLKTAPFATDIHVLITGVANQPVVWIFDSNDRNDGVSRSLIESEDGIIDIIDHVRERVTRASRIARKPKDVTE
jgi:hypothetical protein